LRDGLCLWLCVCVFVFVFVCCVSVVVSVVCMCSYVTGGYVSGMIHQFFGCLCGGPSICLRDGIMLCVWDVYCCIRCWCIAVCVIVCV